MGNIVTVNFRGAELYGFARNDGTFVALKPIVDAIGLDWNGQYQRIKRDPILSEGMCVMHIPFGRGGGQDTACLRLDLVNGWLFTIDSARIRAAEIRERVLAYQRECYGVLAAHFLGRATESPDGAADEPVAVRRALVTEARQTFDVHAARELWRRLKLPLVPGMGDPAQAELPFSGSGAPGRVGCLGKEVSDGR